MAIEGNTPDIIGAGEYGATTVSVARDGSMLRIAFGRNASTGNKVYTGAVLLSEEAVLELKKQLADLKV